MKIRPTRAIGGKALKGGYSFDNACVAFGKTDEVRQKNTKKKQVAHEFMLNKRAEERERKSNS
jgi:hypothetical protein